MLKKILKNCHAIVFLVVNIAGVIAVSSVGIDRGIDWKTCIIVFSILNGTYCFAMAAYYFFGFDDLEN